MKFKHCVFIVAVLGLLLNISGCIILPRTIDIGFFRCTPKSHHISGDETTTDIWGFTETGKQQEYIEIPDKIGGKTVIAISGSSLGDVYLASDNLIKLSISPGIQYIYYEAFNCPNLEIVIFNAVHWDEPIAHEFDLRTKIYVPAGYLDYYRELMTPRLSDNIFEANVSFMLNYEDSENSDFYRVDFVGAGEKIQAPVPPKRENYKFDGWFQEPACENLWNFESSLGQEPMRLYAKWIK